MATTSLAEQLQKLTVPQSSIYKDVDSKASLLFDPKEAASKDRETFFEIGLSGLNELITLHEGFRMFEDTLFNISSKDFERAVQSKAANRRLDIVIDKFLFQLSPYLLLESSHKALEWLVNRYHIHQYNQNAIMSLILPYHETKIFIRFVQLLHIKGGKWEWLEPIKKEGIPLTRQVLYNQCALPNSFTFSFIAKMTLRYIDEFRDRASQCNTVFAFFCSTTVGAIKTAVHVKELMIGVLMPIVIKALDFPADSDFRASAFIVLGYLIIKVNLKEDRLNVIMDKLLTTEFDLSYDMILLINLIYTHQEHMTKLSRDVLNNLSSDIMNTVCGHLKKLVDNKVSVRKFVLAVFSSVLSAVQTDSEEFMKFQQLPQILIDEVDLKDQQPELIINCLLDGFEPLKDDTIAEGDESDIEFVDEDYFATKMLMWYSTILRSMEIKYPDAFDTVIKTQMSSNSKLSGKKRKHLSKALRFKPAVAHKVGGSYLFENLNHVNPELRVEAVNYIAKEFKSLKAENADFVKDSLVSRLNDDDTAVVTAALAIPNEYLMEVMNEADLTSTFVNIVSKSSKKWRPLISEAITKFCSLEILSVNQETVLSLLPYLFPHDRKTAEVAWQIVTSPWGKKLKLNEIIKGHKASFKQKKAEEIAQAVFKALFIDQSLCFDDILDMNQLKKTNTIDICMFLLLKSRSFKKSTVDEIRGTLKLLLECLETRAIVQSSENQPLSSHMMPELIKVARHGDISFEIVEYIFSKIIDDVNVKNIPKPWCNVCQSPDAILLKNLFEICITGCDIVNYKDNYVKLLQKLLHRFFHNARERFDFVANIACGHILYAQDPKEVISPELQVRSLKLLTSFLAAKENSKWIYESDVAILMILFNLNNPVTAIRQCTISFVTVLLESKPDTNKIYVVLLKELLTHKEEVLLDHEQIFQVLATILTKQTPGKVNFRKDCLRKITAILSRDTPAHIKSSFLKILSNFNNANAFSHILQSSHSIEQALAENRLDKKISLDIYESNILKSIYNRINEVTASTFAEKEIWDSIELGLKEYRECILEENQTFRSPCVLILGQINEEVFKKVPEDKLTDLVHLITSAGAFSNNPKISSAASKVMRKIHLNFSDFKSILEGMLKVKGPGATVSKKNKSAAICMLPYELTETNEWRLGVTLLEYLQSKKRLAVDNSFVAMLFQVLKKCLMFEDQSYVEYTKQLILSSLWYYCNNFIDNSDNDQLKSLKSIFNIELIVQCIRGTQNPQTHHHALILLSHSAYLMPEQVLHNTMEIFTFMGTSILRHDDTYSFQIITNIIETLIPILVKMDKDIKNHTQKELQQLQDRVVPVLRIFADVVLHVPEHRRLPLYRKLLETIGPKQFLWVFLALLLETYLAHFNEEEPKKHGKGQHRALADQESPINRLDFGQSILLEFPPEIGLESLINLIVYMKSLPLQKDENSMDTGVDPRDIFSVNGHTAFQLRHYKYVIVTFMNTCLSSSRVIQHCSQATNAETMRGYFKTYIVNILTYIQSITKISDDRAAKYWRVMLHHSYELLDHTNNLLSAPMFLSVVRGLLKHNLATVRRKSMELLNSKIQYNPEMFADVDRELLYSLLPALLDIIKTIETKNPNLSEIAAQELELNQQTALLSLKLLTRLLASENPAPFMYVLESVTYYTCNPNIPGNVMASVVLCLAELCGNLKAHALQSLRRFMPALLKVLQRQRKSETPELVLLSTITAIYKMVESLPLFLSPYLNKILYEYSILLAKWQNYDQECSKVSAVVTKLTNIKRKIASTIPPRVLIPVTNETYQLLLEKEMFDAIGPITSVLADSFANVTTADFNAMHQYLRGFFLSALQLRSDAVKKDVDAAVIDRAEDEVVNALVCLVLKLSETSFRPFYFKIYDWAIRTNVDGHKDRTITFYRLSSSIAEKLKGLFVLFAGHFIKNAADLLDSCNMSKSEQLYFDSDKKCIMLINYIIKTLHMVFLYDSQCFLNKDRFETLMQPVVDQLENTLGGIKKLKKRASESIIPCISQFAVATADDSLWKLLNYQILLKIRHNDAEIRLIALDCLVAMATQLGSGWLPLLADSVPFLAELLEDGDAKIEAATKDAIRKLEQILGEPLEKYF